MNRWETTIIPVDRHPDTHTDTILTLLAQLHPDWHTEANCRGRTDLMYPSRGEPIDRAVALCEPCPVRRQCADQAQSEHHGIWAGVVLRTDGWRASRSRRNDTLDVLADREWHTALHVAETIGVDRSTVSRTLAQFTAAGITERRRYDGPEPGPTPLLYRQKDET